MQINGYNTEVTVTSPKDSYGYFASKHKTDEIEQVYSNSQRIWIGVIIKSPTEDIIIKKNKAFGIFVWESKGKIGIKPETEIKKRQPCQKYRKKLQTGGFLNRYDFAYAGRDTVDQLGKVAPGIIKSASSVINNISQQRINQIIRQEGQEMKRVLLKINKLNVVGTALLLKRNFFSHGQFKLKMLYLSVAVSKNLSSPQFSLHIILWKWLAQFKNFRIVFSSLWASINLSTSTAVSIIYSVFNNFYKIKSIFFV